MPGPLPHLAPARAGRLSSFTGSLADLRAHGASVALFALGVGVSLGLFFTQLSRAHERERSALERQALDVRSGLRSKLEDPLEALESVCSLFEASSVVSRAEFARFVRTALTRHPGLRALEWIPVVPGAERAQYEAAARADGLAGFEFTRVGPDGRMQRAPDSEQHFPIFYMEPRDPTALGFDLGSEPSRRVPIDRARALGTTVASERIRLVEDPPTVYSVAAFCPVLVESESEGAPRLRGVGAEVFRLKDVVAPELSDAVQRGLEVVMLDEHAPPELRLLYESAPGLGAAPRADAIALEIPFADRRWTLRLQRGPGYVSTWANPAWGVLISGIALSGLIALALSASRVIFRLRGRVREAEQLGQYTLLRKLGEGGMGIVWEAKHALLQRRTAIKLLPPERAGAEAIARFEREVQLTSQLTHPNTVAIYDYGRTADGAFYYAMEYLDGMDLQRLVELDGPQPPARVVHVMKQVVSALAEAHALSLVHRDIKPANIVLCERGGRHDVAKVVDFGLVKSVTGQDPTFSAAHVILGTPLFLSPEAIRGPEGVDARSDLYACGAVAYYLLTGRPVFEGDKLVEICSHHLFNAPLPPSLRLGAPLPAALEQIVLRCLEKLPDARFASAQALYDALSECGAPAWTDAEARASWARLDGLADRVSATDRTVAAHSPSLLAIDLRERQASE